MKKIIHVISTLGSGGSEGVLFRLITNNNNNKHYVISFSKGGFYSHKLKKGKIKIYNLDFTNIRNTFFSIYKMKKIFDKIEPDIIQTWLYHADLIGGVVGKICGIGNYLKAEILYECQISPHRLVKDIPYSERQNLLRVMTKITRMSYRYGGATISTYRDGNGKEGLYNRRFAVYNQKTDLHGNPVIREQTKVFKFYENC